MAKEHDTISIPFPRITRNVNRGYVGRVPQATPTRPTSIRFTDEDHQHIMSAASQLDMSFGEFVKWCAYYGAVAVNNELARRSFDDTKTKPELDTSGYT